MKTEEIKKMTFDMGADVCGLAPIERFADAPKGFYPKDIYSKTESVLVFAKRLPKTVLFAESCIPYTHVNSLTTVEVDRKRVCIKKMLGMQKILSECNRNLP